MRLIDANKVEIGFDELCQSPYFKNDVNAKHGAETLMDLCVRSDSHKPNTIDPEALPIVQELRKELERVTAEREALAANSRPAAYGEWEEIRDPDGKIEGWICKCGSESRIKSDFCPYCGADMRGKKEENQC